MSAIPVTIVWLRNKGYWDHGLLLETIANRLAPLNITFTEAHEIRAGEDGGCIIVTHGPEAAFPIKQQQKAIEKLRWCLVLHFGDEELYSDLSGLAMIPRQKLWMQYARPHIGTILSRNPSLAWNERARSFNGHCYAGDRNVLLGWHPSTPGLLASAAIQPERKYLWAFAGQNTNASRKNCCDVLRNLPNGKLHETQGFAQGLAEKDFLELMLSAKIAPCPSGPVHCDSFRVYEALECGCLPIADRRAPLWPKTENYFLDVIESEPFPTLSEWTEFPALLNKYANDPNLLKLDTEKALAWWRNYKQGFARNMEHDILELRG